MKARTLFAGGLVASLLATAACSFTQGFDGFAGPEGNPDAAIDSTSGGDTGSVPGVDGAVPVDAGDGAVLDADAGDPNTPPVFVDAGSSFCGTQETTQFCEDFDTNDLPVSWVKEGAYARLTSYTAKSAPNTFLVAAPETASGGTFVSKITRVMDAPSTNMVLAFDFMPEKVNLGTSFLILAAVEYTKNAQKYSMRLVYSSGSVRLEESDLVPPPANKDTYHPFFTIPMNKWTRVKLDFTASGASPGVQISLDGAVVGAREALTPTVGMDPTPTILLGAVFAGNPHSGWTLRYDDLTVTYR
ncbi:MAG: hypothetical protein JWP97_5431 [Labilithrix sp.]|nr:hypothetical protein [Labilithrix sp.]